MKRASSNANREITVQTFTGILLTMMLLAGSAASQEGWLHADFRREREKVGEACGTFGVKKIPGCAIELFTDHPLHIAAGSMPPQNGFGIGAAFVAARNTTNWRTNFSMDAVGAISGAWRAGAYMTLVHNPAAKIHVVRPGEKPNLSVHPFTEIDLYVQSISLNKLNYFGLGNDSARADASLFGMTQTIVGGSVIKPVYEWPVTNALKLSLFGEINGRFVDIRGKHGESVPSIETLYTDATAPGLASQPGFIQFGEGVRINPVIRDRFEFDYRGGIQEFVAPSNSHQSFSRWNIDLSHTLHLYGHTKSAPKVASGNGPNSCAPAKEECPSITANRSGSIGMRFYLSESIASATSFVPFYFEQTLGGGDINGAMALGSYQDYRFRAPNLLLLQESFEHSIWGPLGIKVMADEGRVALRRGDLGFSHLRHSYAAGLTLRAGGFPMVSMMFAWGGPEGHHNIFNMNTSLLGGSARPLLD